MEPVKCPGCHRLVSAKLAECPFCKHSIDDAARHASSSSMKAVKPYACPHCTRLIAPALTSCPFCKKEVTPKTEGEERPVKCPKCGRPYQLKSGACPFCNREAKAQDSSPSVADQAQAKVPSVFPPAHARPSSRPPGRSSVIPPDDDVSIPALLIAPVVLAVAGVGIGLYAMSVDRSLGPNWLSAGTKAIAFVGGLAGTGLVALTRGAKLRAQLERDERAWALPVILLLLLGLVVVALSGLTFGFGVLANGVAAGASEEVECSVSSSVQKAGNATPWVTELSCKVHGDFLATTVEIARPERPRFGEAMAIKVRRGRLGIWVREE